MEDRIQISDGQEPFGSPLEVMVSLYEHQLATALKLAEKFGDGNAGVAYKREKGRWYALLFFDLSSERMGFIERGWGDTPEAAFELLLDRVKIQAAKRQAEDHVVPLEE